MSRPCLALDASGRQVAFPLQLVRGALAVLTRCRVALETVRGSWPDDVSFGLPVLEWLEDPSLPDIEVESVVRLMLEDIEGVVSVVDVQAQRVDDDLHVTAHLKVRDDDGELVEARVGALDDDLRMPAVWLLLLSPSKVLPGNGMATYKGQRAVARVAPRPPIAFAEDAEGMWDPLLAPGTYTLGGTYDNLLDQSGHGRHMGRDSANCTTTPVAYPVAGGTEYLPNCQFLGGLWWTNGAPLGWTAVSVIAWGHHSTPIEHLQALGVRLNDAYGRRNAVFMVRWDSTDGTLAIVETGSATLGAGMPTCDFPQRADGGSIDGWWVYGLTYDGAGNWRWHVIGDMDDGAGIKNYPLQMGGSPMVGNAWSATPAALLAALATAGGVTAQDTGSATPREAGGGGVWSRALDEGELKRGMVAAAAKFSAAAAAGAAAVLGVS